MDCRASFDPGPRPLTGPLAHPTPSSGPIPARAPPSFSTTTRPTIAPRSRPGWAAHLWFQLRFTPTSSSWLNSVECWFSAVTKRRIRLGSLVSAPDLMKAAT